jgi:hypothetical protein
LQSSSLLALFLPDSSASVFLDKWPHLVSDHFIGIDRLDFLVMHHLPLDGSPLHETGDGVEGAARSASNASEAAPLTMRLQDEMHFFRGELAAVVDRIEGISKGVVTGGAFEPLTALGSTAMFMSFEMTAEWAFHWLWQQLGWFLSSYPTLLWLTTKKGFQEIAESLELLSFHFEAGDGIRTHDINLGKVALYHWATPACFWPLLVSRISAKTSTFLGDF